ncbi:P-loop NTPase fold protein [Spiroplasma endosymbiont of Panorpa germanica]|uniref:P-loop NTPase fold protein n=1 Tax=Spiroplasma endosymbiont of Panorpa germanica TaxID=3066314 RepID=UPI0030CB71D2
MNIENIAEIITEAAKKWHCGKSDFNNFCLSGKWGSGKTTVIDKIEKQSEKEGYKAIVLNAWNYEIVRDDTIMLVLKDIVDQIIPQEKKSHNLKEKFGKIFSLILKSKIGISPKEIWGALANESKNNTIEDLNSNHSVGVSSLITNVISEVVKTVNEFENNYIIFFDELDRCSNETVLTIITTFKNILFNMKSKKIFFVCSLNEDHINSMLSINSEKYIDKIFDQKIRISDFIEWDNKITEIENKLLLQYISQNPNKDFRKINKIYKNTLKAGITFENDYEQLFLFQIFKLKEDHFEDYKNAIKSIEIDDSWFSSLFNLENETEEVKQNFDRFLSNLNYYKNSINAFQIETQPPHGIGSIFKLKTAKQVQLPLLYILPFFKSDFDSSLSYAKNDHKSHYTTFIVDYSKNKNFIYESCIEFLDFFFDNIKKRPIVWDFDFEKILKASRTIY